MEKLLILESMKNLILKNKTNKLTKIERANYFKLQEEIHSTNFQIRAAYNNFNFVTDNDSISYYAYLIKALEMKYDLLIKQAKKIEGA